MSRVTPFSSLFSKSSDMGEMPISDDLLIKGEKGVTRDLVARAVKISSGTIFERSEKVVEKADEYKREGNDDYSKLLIALLNKSPSTACELIKGNVDLSERDIELLKTGKVSVRSLLPKKEPTHQQPGNDFILFSVTIETIKTAVKKLSDPRVIKNIKKTKLNREIESIVKDLQKLLIPEPSKTTVEVGAENVTG